MSGLLGEREGEEVVQHRDVRPRHHGADAVADFDDAEHGQRAQRLAHDRPADAELGCEFALGDQAVAGFQRTREQAFAQEGEHLLETFFALGRPLEFHPGLFLLILVRPVR